MRNMVGAIGRFFNNIKRSTIYPLGSPGIYNTFIIRSKLEFLSLGVVLQAGKPSYKPTPIDINYKPSKPSYYKARKKPSYDNDMMTMTVLSPGMKLNNDERPSSPS